MEKRIEREIVKDIDGMSLLKVTDIWGYGTHTSVSYYNKKKQLHRIGGPAKSNIDGSLEYYIEGKLHRISGPAIIRQDGTQFYYVDGKEFTEEEYPKAIKAYKIKQLVG
jgi:hypothetical protein